MRWSVVSDAGRVLASCHQERAALAAQRLLGGWLTGGTR